MNNKLNNNLLCNNCLKNGHQYHSCKLPINSYGIIVFRNSSRGLEYLMIRRKDSFSYIDFVRGKYSIHNMTQLQNIIDEITLVEKNRLLTENYENIKNLLWSNEINNHKTEEIISQKKFENIKNGIYVNENTITLKSIIENSKTNFLEQEWEFPKGRRNYQEKEIDCAIREFEEETGYSKNNIDLMENIIPFEETFVGSNYKSYKHKYYIAYMEETINNLDNFQKTEVSKIEWKTIDECLNSIRPNTFEKKRIIINVNNFLVHHKMGKIIF